MPFYIPRARMPQIDEADYPALIDFLTAQGRWLRLGQVEPETLRAHQRVDQTKIRRMSEDVLSKRLLTSADKYVLDGNHRWHGNVLAHRRPNIMELDLPFEAAIALLFKFPKTYSYGDGAFHPIHN